MNSIIEHQLDTFDPEGHPELKAAYDECIREHEKTIDALRANGLKFKDHNSSKSLYTLPSRSGGRQ